MKQLSLFNLTHTPIAWSLYVDGASRNNPGAAGAGIYLIKEQEAVVKTGVYLGIKTNNQAEYMALLLGLLYAQKYMHANDTLAVKSDSQLIVRQLSGHYAVKHPELKKLFKHVVALLPHTYKVCHIPREENAIADKLANMGIDKKIPIPEEFLQQWSLYEQSVQAISTTI